MFLICCWRKYSRCWRSSSSRVRIWMLCFRVASLDVFVQQLDKAVQSVFQVVRLKQFVLLVDREGKLPEIKLTSTSLLSRFFKAKEVSGEISSDSSITLALNSLQVSISVLNSSDFSSFMSSSITETLPFRKGRVEVISSSCTFGPVA